MKHYNIKVSGKVQGVYFRASTKMEAERLGINGFVQNEMDGSVYVEAEGATEQIEQLLNWCKIGSPMSNVEKVEFEKSTTVGFQTFDIRR
ncbi:MAG: acylphosphatase [Bacteroidota bacterium]